MAGEKEAVLKTLKYSNLFNCPQTKEEIEKFLITKINSQRLGEILKSSKEISSSGNYYCLKGREEIVKTRKIREKESLLKLKKAKRISILLSKIPSILLIGVSGSVAVKNAKKEDDIDLFFITENKTVWVTRLVIILLLKILGKHRGREEKKIKDKFCLNMFLARNAMAFKKNKQNIYTAHEICQLVPLFQRENCYSEFLTKNNWTNKFLPNAQALLREEHKDLKTKKKKIRGKWFLSLFEVPARTLQIIKIQKNLTKETVSSNVITFHPKDEMEETIRRYNK